MTLAPGSTRRARRDLALVALGAALSFALATALEFNERLESWLAAYEHWQADELLLTFIVLPLGLAWYAWRRSDEAHVALREREAAQAHARELLDRNRELAHRLIRLHESERRALARDLHDEVGQACTMLRLEMARIRRVARSDAEAVLVAAQRADASAEHLHAFVREMLHRLRPAQLDALGLPAALQQLCEDWEARSGVACLFFHEADAPPLDDAIDITIYRVTQEALSNVMRHARARQVRISLSQASSGSIELLLQDDGCGMDDAGPSQGLGLLGARERAAAVGGVLDVTSARGQGTRVRLRIPTPTPGPAGEPRP